MGVFNYKLPKGFFKILTIFLILSLLTGCSAYEKAKAKVTGNNTDQNETETTETCQCPDPNRVEADKVAYFFEKHQDGLISLLEHSNEWIYCIFPTLENTEISQALIRADQDRDVKIIFDRSSSFEQCDIACVPRTDSVYNNLLSNNLAIKVTDTTERFCVTDDGVYWWNGNFDKYGIKESHVFFSEALAQKYKKHFNTIW